MLLTRETDYAMRLLRGLLTGEKRSVGQLSEAEMIPQQFAYKIIKKLNRAGLVEITRGVEGGCRLSADLEQVSLYDLMEIVEGCHGVNACMSPDYRCPRRERGGCLIHTQLAGLQKKIDDELRSYDLKTLLTGAAGP